MSTAGAPEENSIVSCGAVIWICGVPASGKSTLAAGLLHWLQEQGHATLWLDSDDLRPVLTPFAGYDAAGRDAFYNAIGHMAVLGAKGGAIVVISATANRRRYRESVRNRVTRFVEIALTADVNVLRSKRDVKGLYAKAERGEIEALPGLGVLWERSDLAELTLDTTEEEPENVLHRACSYLEGHLDLTV